MLQQNNLNGKDDIVDYFECGVCYQLFDDKQHFPRLLMCGHTLCQRCISRIINKDQIFTCSFCKCNLGHLRFGLVYKNFSLIKLMQLNQIQSKQKLSFTIIKPTFSEIVDELDRAPKQINKLIIKRTQDDQANPFDFDLIRSNRNSMRFYKLLVLFQKVQHFEFWVKFSAHGFEECLAQSLFEMKRLKTVHIVNQYDQYQRLRQIIALTGKQNISFTIDIKKWQP